MPKIYTKTGDEGQTGLIGGQRVCKDVPQIEAYGTVDELNSVLGVVLGLATSEKLSAASKSKIKSILLKIQNELFNLGCQLSKSTQAPKDLPTVTDQEVKDLEDLIDTLEKDLPPLQQFILPGGDTLSGMIHLARSICRRAERRCIGLLKETLISPTIVIYLNRLSDTLFVLARWTRQQLNLNEIPWQPKKPY